MICMNFETFMRFLELVELKITGSYPVYIIWADYPAVYVWMGKAFCTGGVIL